jgi:hypothetical protein
MHVTTIDPKRRACLSHYVKAGQKWEVEEAEEGVIRLTLLVKQKRKKKAPRVGETPGAALARGSEARHDTRG